MKIENIPAGIKSKSLKEARDEINQILTKLENEDYNINKTEEMYKRLINLNKHVESLFKVKSKNGKYYYEILDIMNKNMKNNNKIKSKIEIRKFFNCFLKEF